MRVIDGQRCAQVFIFECRHCGRTHGSNDGRAVGPCLHRQTIIDFTGLPWVEQLRALNRPHSPRAGDQFDALTARKSDAVPLI